MTLSWKHLGAIPKAAIESPPVGSGISTYVLDVAPDGRPLYYCEPDDDQRGAELWAFDGSAWKRLHQKRLTRLDELESGGWDPSRDALCVFGFDFDSQTRTWVVQAFAIGLDGKERQLTFTGEPPVIESESDGIEPGTFDVRGAFTFDHARRVWVCFTRLGIWELDGNGAWTKRLANDKKWPTEWSNETGGAFFDPVARRTVFWVQEAEEYAVQARAWDGVTLTELPMKGLPKLTHGLFDVSCQLAGHPKHGVLLQIEGQVFALEGKTWKQLPTEGKGPPRMEYAQTAFSPRHGLFIGPGKHAKAGNWFQRVFFVLHDGVWSSHGVVNTPSELASSGYGAVRMGHADGAWIATSTNNLRTWRREGVVWNELVDSAAGEKLMGSHPLTLVWDDKRLWAVTWKGAIAEFGGKGWKVICKGESAFKDRRDFAAAFDPQGRLVVWGGSANNRKLNDTLFFENGKWRVVKKASPQPADFKHGKDGIYVDFHVAFDSALGRFVRFGFDELAVLQDDETWSPVKVKGYSKAIWSRAWGHLPVHDAETGETLLVDFENARVVRFDLSGCTEVEQIEWPAALLPAKQHDESATSRIRDTFAWDPKTQAVYALDMKNSQSVFMLELGPAFAKAKKVGARKTLGPASAKKTAEQKRVLYRVKAAKVEVSSEPRAGFVLAEQLDVQALKVMVGVPAEGIRVAKAAKKGALTKSRIGGPAPAVAAKKWPKHGKTPMGFLLQLETGALLKKHAGVAVFCSIDGEATTDDDHNAVVLLKAGELVKTAATPKEVPELPARAITFEPLKVEIDERRALALGEKDPVLVQVLEKFGASKEVQEPLAQKRGGVPQFLQGEVALAGWKLVAQLDFDQLDVSKAWPEAGLAGCVYVFVKDDEKDAFAMWQYT